VTQTYLLFRGTGVYDFTDLTSLTLRYFVSQDRGDTRQYDRVAFADDKPSRSAGENSDPYEFYASEYYSHEIDVSGFSGDFSLSGESQLELRYSVRHYKIVSAMLAVMATVLHSHVFNTTLTISLIKAH